MKTTRMILCGLLLTMTVPAQEAVSFPKILEGSGHVCWGHLWHTDKTLYWKAVGISCRSPYTVVSHDGQHWLLKVEKSKSCAYELIDVKAYSTYFWTVTGYDRASNLKVEGEETMSCSMYAVTAAEVARGRKWVPK